MTPTRTSLLILASLALSSSLALSQQPPAPAAPAAPSTAPAPADGTAPRVHPVPADMRQRIIIQRNMRGAAMARIHDGFRDGEGSVGNGFRLGPQGMWWKNPMVVELLTLTPDQVKRMDGIFQESRLQLIDLKANVEKQEVMLEPLLSANPPDTNKAMAQIDKVAQARADLEKARARMLLGIRGVLTPDQWTKLSTRGPGPGGFGPQGGGVEGGPGGQPGGPGGPRARSPRGGGPPPPPNSNNLVDPIDEF